MQVFLGLVLVELGFEEGVQGGGVGAVGQGRGGGTVASWSCSLRREIRLLVL